MIRSIIAILFVGLIMLDGFFWWTWTRQLIPRPTATLTAASIILVLVIITGIYLLLSRRTLDDDQGSAPSDTDDTEDDPGDDIPFSESEWRFAQAKALEVYRSIPEPLFNEPAIADCQHMFSPREMVIEIEASSRIGEDHTEMFAAGIRDEGHDPEIESVGGLTYAEYPGPEVGDASLLFVKFPLPEHMDIFLYSLQKDGFRLAVLNGRVEALSDWCRRFKLEFVKVQPTVAEQKREFMIEGVWGNGEYVAAKKGEDYFFLVEPTPAK